MTFTDLSFILLILPSVLLLHTFITNIKARNILLVLFSVGYYFYCEPKYAYILLGLIILTYLTGTLLENKKNKLILTGYVLILVTLLTYFKYLNFLIRGINLLTHGNLLSLSIIMPLGISFYIFQSIAYTADVFKSKITAEKNIFNLAAFLTFFPTVMSGPILRYGTFIEQWNEREITTERIAKGLRRFIYGLAKKVILANQLALIVNYCHNNIPDLGFFLAWAGAICYTLQIYFDFSGYSDMALGISNALGFTFPENFNFPYLSNSVQEFWRRWHISLSHWFRDYIYIPLGGNRVSTPRWFLNIFIVWFLTGLWHGASMNFICWGLYYGCWLVFEKYTNKYLNKIPKLIRTFLVFIIVTIGWILFRASDLHSALAYIKELVNFSIRPNLLKIKLLDILYLYPVVGISLIGCIPIFKTIYDKLDEKAGIICDLILICLLLMSIMIILNSSYSPFIYFNF